MKVAIVSEFRPGYEVGLEQSYARAFASLGHSVARIPTVTPTGNFPRGIKQIAQLRHALKNQVSLQDTVLSESPQLVLIIKGKGVLGESVERWRREGAHVMNVFPDNPFEAAAAGIVDRFLLSQFQQLDRLFVHDRIAVGQLRELGVRSEFLAFARDPEIHDPAMAPITSADPIVFVGNPDPERIRYLRAVADLGLGLYGNWDWAHLSPTDPLAQCVRGGVQLGSALVKTMRSARISINVLRHSQKTAHNMRTFETPSCGTCALSEDTIGVRELMDNGKEVVLFSSPVELRQQALRLLSGESAVQEIAELGWERVRADTYARRAEELLSYV